MLFGPRRPACGAGTPQHGLSSNKMALITSDCDAMRNHGHQTAPRTCTTSTASVPQTVSDRHSRAVV